MWRVAARERRRTLMSKHGWHVDDTTAHTTWQSWAVQWVCTQSDVQSAWEKSRVRCSCLHSSVGHSGFHRQKTKSLPVTNWKNEKKSNRSSVAFTCDSINILSSPIEQSATSLKVSKNSNFLVDSSSAAVRIWEFVVFYTWFFNWNSVWWSGLEAISLLGPELLSWILQFYEQRRKSDLVSVWEWSSLATLSISSHFASSHPCSSCDWRDCGSFKNCQEFLCHFDLWHLSSFDIDSTRWRPGDCKSAPQIFHVELRDRIRFNHVNSKSTEHRNRFRFSWRVNSVWHKRFPQVQCTMPLAQ